MVQRLLVALVCALVACGASDVEIQASKTAMYTMSPNEMYEFAKGVATDMGYAIGQHDDQGWKFVTAPKFFSPEGDSETPGAEGFVHMRDGSVQVQYSVAIIVTAQHKVAVLIEPVTFQKIGWSPKPRELASDDPYLPTFVTGRGDALLVEIHKRAKDHLVPGS
jgi:hypothetical protein